METTQETFADIVNSLIPRNISLAKLSREADIEYSYFHSLMNGRRKDKAAPPGDEGKILRASPPKGMAVLNALERLGVPVALDVRERMVTACLPVPEGYRLVSDARLQENGLGGLLFSSGLADMNPDELRLFGDIIEAWTEKKRRDEEARNPR